MNVISIVTQVMQGRCRHARAKIVAYHRAWHGSGLALHCRDVKFEETLCNPQSNLTLKVSIVVLLT